MATRNIGIIIDGASGRLGTTQHLRSLMAIRSEGGLTLADGARLVPEPVLLGRDPAKLTTLSLVTSIPPAACATSASATWFCPPMPDTPTDTEEGSARSRAMNCVPLLIVESV